MKGARIWIVNPSTGPHPEPLGAPELDYDSKGGFGTDEKLELSEKSQAAKAKTDALEDQSSGAQTSGQGSSEETEKKKQKFKLIDPGAVPGHYYVKRIKTKMYALYEGAGPDDEFAGSRKVIDISGEGFFNKKSSYTEVLGQCRHARMYGVPPWYSCDRELQDFEGNLWLFHTKAPTWTDDIEIKRRSDGVDIAFFELAAWSFTGIGILDIKVALSPEIFYLMLSAWYQIQYDGFMKGVRFWIVDASTGPHPEPLGAPELDYDSKEDLETDEKLEPGEKSQDANAKSGAETSAQGSSKEKEKKKTQKFKLIDPGAVPGHYYVKRIKAGAYALYEGAGPDDEFAGSRKLMDIGGEGFFSKKSSYTEVSGQARHARMYGVPPWYSCDRELEDFEGNLWLLHTKAPTWYDDIEIKRKSDGADVAFFDLAAWSFSGLGILDVKVPLTPDIFYLVLSAWYVKNNEDMHRRRAARSRGAS
ncbi:hypothetical protein M407DRAFT_24923 [Tulasnella calospora MUT 4182]|uniref:Uncharacterized protein n=1 Tax=Tulasnella calospora MUT 4182 TaxID=1051891 RepID=A0A0C3Q7V6_9AGAM|nr:hypothetical protein M407DRAFT_24923 [Tulasnella calospora MUT 4182]